MPNSPYPLYSFVDNASLKDYSAGEKWHLAQRIYGDEVPEDKCLAIWGREVVDARRVEKCPECGYAGDIVTTGTSLERTFVLCPYHESRQCSCGAVLGTTTLCSCDEE